MEFRTTKMTLAIREAQRLADETGKNHQVFSRKRGPGGMRYYKVAVVCPPGYSVNHYC